MSHIQFILAKIKIYFQFFTIYLSLVGFFSFACFILEEAFQTTTFASWNVFDQKEYRLAKREIQTMEALRTSLIIVNNIGGWLNPFGWIAYNGYVNSEREYIDALKSKLFAYAPHMFEGEVVTFTFNPQESEQLQDCTAYRNGAITVLSLSEIKGLSPVVTGMVKVEDEKVIVDARK